MKITNIQPIYLLIALFVFMFIYSLLRTIQIYVFKKWEKEINQKQQQK